MDAFGALDESMHGGEAAGLDEIRKTVDSSLTTLKSALDESK